MKNSANQRLLLATVFVCGFTVMAFEIIGSRVLAPFLGTSTFVWVSIIGIILLAMSCGYYYGGKKADEYASIQGLGRFMLFAAAAICLMNLGKNQLLMVIDPMGFPLLVKAVVASFLLFTLPSFFLAAVFPYALKLSLQNIDDAGKVAGRFYATSTIGSIAGTFLSATILIPTFGTTNILWILASILLIASLVIRRAKLLRLQIFVLLLLTANVVFSIYPRTYVDIDSAYNRIWILDGIAQDRPTRYLALNGHVNSGMWVDAPIVEQLYPYSEYFRLAEHFNPSFNKTLMLGAGGYTYPKLHQYLWPEKPLDVVELDPELTMVSAEYFAFNATTNTRIFHEDARTFLNQNDARYDVIISDVFTSPLDVPFHMTTQECYKLQQEALSDSGVLILNVLGKWEGKYDRFLKTQMRTAASVFKHVFLFEVEDGRSSGMKNNIVIALKSDHVPSMTNKDPLIQSMLEMRRYPTYENSKVLTDDFAPANWLLQGN